MSVNYIDKSTGDLIRVAGQGKAEYGASTERKGDITIPATTAGNFQTVNVVFAQAMPDNDYTVVIDEGGNTWAHCTTNVTNKTATGFTLFFLNVAAADAPQMTFKYRAFKLYTDTEYNNLLNNAVLTSDVTDSVTNGNMNPVTSNAVYDTLMNITTLTPTKTANVGTIYEAEFLRIGRLVFVNLNLIVSSGILFTGLPKPTSRQTFTINGFYETDKALRLIVNTDGSIETDNSSAITNQNVGGHIVYITAEN